MLKKFQTFIGFANFYCLIFSTSIVKKYDTFGSILLICFFFCEIFFIISIVAVHELLIIYIYDYIENNCLAYYTILLLLQMY